MMAKSVPPLKIAGALLDTEEKTFSQRLSSYTIVDIGILESVTKTAAGIYGTFRCNRESVDGSVVRYYDVEILNIGSLRGGFFTGMDGEDTYLLFGTVGSMPSVIDRKSSGTTTPYSILNLKAIGVSSALTWISRAGFDRSGNLLLEFPESHIAFNIDSSVSYTHGTLLQMNRGADGSLFISLFAGQWQLSLSSDGTWYSALWSGDYVVDMRIVWENGTTEHRKWSRNSLSQSQKGDLLNYTDFLYVEKQESSGAWSRRQYDQSGNVISEEYVSSSGEYTLKGTGISIDARTGPCSIKGAGLSIDAGTGKLKLISAGGAFNYSSWLNSLIDTLKTIAVDPGSHVLLPTVTASLTLLATQLQSGTE